MAIALVMKTAKR